MIQSIFNLFLKLINFIIMLIIRVIMLCFPALGLSELNSVFSAFFGLLEGAVNMTFFIVGPSFSTFATVISTLFLLKHVALPVVNLVRKYLLDLF